MGDLTPKERFIRSLKGKTVDKVPVCSVTQTGTTELMKTTKAYWPQAHYDAEKMADLAIAGNEVAGLEAVRYPFCVTVIAQALGCTIMEGTSDAQPHQEGFPCARKEDVNEISVPSDLLERERIATVLKATDIVKKRVDDDIPVIAGMIGPAGIAFHLAGEKNYFMWLIKKPDLIKDLVRIGTEVCIEYSNALFEHGVDAVTISDPEGGPALISPQMFESFVLPEYKIINKKVNGLKMLHMCGDSTSILESLSKSGFDGISIEEKVEVKRAKEIIGNRACLIGNVSPSSTLLSKSPEDVKKEAMQCIRDGVGILAPGCGIAPHTPLKNMKAFVAARDEYYLEDQIL
ncbi:methylcobamide:CoM methyltransferase MtaA [Methanococcoides alaskense]|uniref:[methyl-Co(III) methanol-specific corrinoid protein]:coenzyme M methyltransferase n=1 Tax=Methanococcoides alaskense TaxID=325778 RepID=A0AA90ZDD1_9EURY|nr:methylcobamide:CoM methyltransferase MtaA [Methanococcoides alaskense]MDR6223373.1 [methyl-Co(III) methanol-specific corrinoid protein]:coenzyme M methyltransferase [Methanococcoides alaskense]